MPKKNINNNYLFIIALLSVIIIVLLYVFIRPFNNITTVQIEQPTNSCQNNICVNPPSVDFNYNYTNFITS